MESFAFDWSGSGYVLRRAPSAAYMADRPFGHVDEAALVRAAFDAGVKAPEVVGVLEDGDGLGTGYVMRRVIAEVSPAKILADPPPSLLADLGRLPNPGRQEAQQLMLVANSGWRDLAGGALCTNESGERALLRLRLDLNTLSAEVLTQWLTAFVVAAETWAERLAAPASPAADKAIMPRDFPGMSPFNLA